MALCFLLRLFVFRLLRLKRFSTLTLNFFFQAEDGIRDHCVTGVHVCSSDLPEDYQYNPVRAQRSWRDVMRRIWAPIAAVGAFLVKYGAFVFKAKFFFSIFISFGVYLWIGGQIGSAAGWQGVLGARGGLSGR